MHPPGQRKKTAWSFSVSLMIRPCDFRQSASDRSRLRERLSRWWSECEQAVVEFQQGTRLSFFIMSKPACPMCEMTEVLDHPERWECVTCGHEWPREAAPEAAPAARVVKDAHGNILTDGDCVILIKDLKLGGGSQVLKGGS